MERWKDTDSDFIDKGWEINSDTEHRRSILHPVFEHCRIWGAKVPYRIIGADLEKHIGFFSSWLLPFWYLMSLNSTNESFGCSTAFDF